MLRRARELPLERDASQRSVPWVIAVMVHLAALALAGAFALDTAATRWKQELQGALTVQVSPTPEAAVEPQVEAALAVLRTTEGVAEATALEADKVAALLEPWLGPGNVSPELPIPRLIDVRLAPGADLDLAVLQGRLTLAAPGAQLDDHSRWLTQVVGLSRTAQFLALAIVVLAVTASIAIVVFTTRTGLAVHHDVIEVLHLVGARDGYIARQFQSHALILGLKGGVLGLVLAAASLFVITRIAGNLAGPLVPALALEARSWVALASLPLFAGLIATMTARATVMRALSRLV